MDQDSMWSAVIGGAVGSLLIGVGWLIARLAVVRREMRRNSEVADTINRRLEMWVVLENARLRGRISSIHGDLAQRGLTSSGAALVEPKRAKEKALADYAERWLDTRRDFADLEASERWFHDLVRWFTRNPLRFSSADDVKPILDEWRRPVTNGEQARSIDDPTTVRAADVVAV
jgi:hypothetical protein